MSSRVLVLDHRDSFVFTLVDQFARLGAEVQTLRTGLTFDSLQSRLAEFDPDLILLSPGTGHPSQAGVMVPFLESEPRRPILGVCLGHQAMAVAAGGVVGRAPQPVHGQGSYVVHEGDAAFEDLPTRFCAGRYHSLTVTSVPETFEVIARCEDEPSIVMAMRHVALPYLGLQFHPESILTPFGARLIANILQHATDFSRDSSHDPRAHDPRAHQASNPTSPRR